MPGANVAVETAPAELLQVPPTGTVARIPTVIEVGVAGVSGLEIKSLTADRETNPFGVTGQEQHDTNSSSGENTYTFAQTAPVTLAVVPDCRPAFKAPVLEMLMTESPAVSSRSTLPGKRRART